MYIRFAPLLRIGDKTVTDSRFRHQMFWHRGIFLHFFPQVGHMHAYIVHVFGMAWPPYRFQQLLVGDDPVRL